MHIIDRITFYLSDQILPVTRKIAEDMHALEGIPGDKLTVLPSGTNTDLFHPMDRSRCCRMLGFAESLKYIGFIGTFLHHQGIDILIEAAPVIIRKYPQVRFLILGDGPMKSTWQNSITKNCMESLFIFPGHVPYEQVPTYCAVMDICVAPFRNSAGDSSGVKIFDYLASGKPVVASDVGDSSEFFAESGGVMFVPPEHPASLAEAINHLLENETLCDEMGLKGRSFVTEKYSRTKIAEMVEEAALKLLISHG